MLMLTPTAVEAVRSLTSTAGTAEDAGLRISTNDGAQTLELAVASAPAEHDRIVDTAGSRVFLDEQAAAFLDDKVLDTSMDESGRSAFVLAPQAGPSAN
ncbi:hypothetical protein [Nocardia sp. alder85J]|uniref:hypothetical protein n=1 Tax=Nocardia sp. alder85J TaxID=2862949 RepID=UPI001CD4B9DF|nr:hypothetical protein [Nocardia sp. alder85J]MCX4098295.1 hypothetical protein [Nocardia sp. alder85J]